MARPPKRQRVAQFLKFNDVTQQQAADAMGVSLGRAQSIVKGLVYPKPHELAILSQLCNNMPYQVMFDPELLVFVDNWPPPRGTGAQVAEIKRQRDKAGE